MNCFRISGENLKEHQLEKKDRENIKKILLQDFEEKIKNCYSYCIPDNTLVSSKNYFNYVINMDYNKLIKKYINSTLKDDGEKNNSIKDSDIYIIKNEDSMKIIRLESKEDIILTTSTIERVSRRDNYKICSLEKKEGLIGIKVLDSTEKIAKYWLKKFLELKIQNTPEILTNEFLEIIDITNNKQQNFIIQAIINKCNQGEKTYNVLNLMEDILSPSDYKGFEEEYFGREEFIEFDVNQLEKKLNSHPLTSITSNIKVKRPQRSIGTEDPLLINSGNKTYLALNIDGEYLNNNKSEFSKIREVDINV